MSLDVILLAAASDPTAPDPMAGEHLTRALDAYHSLCRRHGWYRDVRQCDGSYRTHPGLDAEPDDPRWDSVRAAMAAAQ